MFIIVQYNLIIRLILS